MKVLSSKIVNGKKMFLIKEEFNETIIKAQDGANLDSEGRAFIKNWYTQRSELPQFKDISNKFLKSLPLVKTINVSEAHLKKMDASAYELEGDIYINNKNVSPKEDVVHEITHAIHDRSSNYLYGENIIKKNIVPKSEYKVDYNDFGRFNYDYYSTPTEVYARLNTFRDLMKLDPKKNYSTEDAKSLIEQYKNPKAYNEKQFKADKDKDLIAIEYNKLKDNYIKLNPKNDIENTNIDDFMDVTNSYFIETLDPKFFNEVSEVISKYKSIKNKYDFRIDKSHNIETLFKIIGDDPIKLSNLLNNLADNNINETEKLIGKYGINNLKNETTQLKGIIEDNQGQWKYPGQITKINSPNITMKGVNYPVLGISEQTGEQKLMFPENNYKFKSTKAVIEIPFSNKPYFFNGGVVEESVTEYPIIQKNRKIITQNGKLIKKENVDSTFTKNYFQQGGMTKSKYKPSVEKSLFSDNYLYNEETSKKLKNDLEYLLSSNQDIKNINGYKIGKAKDEQGEYYSFYKLIKKNFGKNDEYYDRVYVKDLKLKNYEEGDIAKEKYYPNESKGLNLKEESNFVFDWLNSSKAKDIAKKRGIDLKERIDRLKNTNLFLLESDEYNQAVPYVGNSSSGAFDTEKGYVYLDKDKNKKYSGVHELNHASTNANEFLPKKDIEDIQNKIFTNDKYLKDPTEVQARINVTRKYLKDLKIYDPLIEDFTKEHLKKLKKYIKNNYNIIESNASDLLNISKSDEDLIWLMNNIVYQDNHQNDNKTQLAQAGTTVKINKDNVVKEYDRRSPEYKAMYDSGRLMSYDKSTDTYRATPLETFEVKTKAPQWLIDKRNIEKNFTKEKFVKKYLPKWSGSMGETADNLSENAQKDYDKKVNDKLANVLLKSNQKKGNKEANNLDWYNSFSEKEREIIQQSSLANKFAPAQRAYDLDVSNSTKKYNTTDVLTDADKLSQSVQGTPERFRLFPNAENNIESYVNPGMFLGSMAKGLGNVPKDIKNENYGQAALSIATPLSVGALAGIGNPSTGQFVNNLTNPFAGLKSYGKDVYYTSKMKNKLTLPEYENVFRWQPDKVPQGLVESGLKKLTPEQHSLQGSWYTKLEQDLPFYMRTRYGKGEIKHIKLPQYKIKELEKNMPDFAKGMSGKENTLAKDIDFKYGELILPKNLRNKTKSIRVENNPTSSINENEVKDNLSKLLYGFPQTPEQYLKTYKKIQGSPLEKSILQKQAQNYLNIKLNKFDSPILGINRKFFPFKFGGKIEQYNNEKTVKILNTKIENGKKYFLINE